MESWDSAIEWDTGSADTSGWDSAIEWEAKPSKQDLMLQDELGKGSIRKFGESIASGAKDTAVQAMAAVAGTIHDKINWATGWEQDNPYDELYNRNQARIDEEGAINAQADEITGTHRYVRMAGSGVGSFVPAVIGAYAGIPALLTFGVSSYGEGRAYAKSKGYSEGEAELYGVVSGGITAAVTFAGGKVADKAGKYVFGQGAKTAEEVVNTIGAKAAESLAKSATRKFGIKATGWLTEGGEELAEFKMQRVQEYLTGLDPEALNKPGGMDAAIIGTLVGFGVSSSVEAAKHFATNKSRNTAKELDLPSEYVSGPRSAEKRDRVAEVANEVAEAINTPIDEGFDPDEYSEPQVEQPVEPQVEQPAEPVIQEESPVTLVTDTQVEQPVSQQQQPPVEPQDDARFVPTEEWQEIPEGAILTPGLDIRTNFETGVQEARIMPEQPAPPVEPQVEQTVEPPVEPQQEQTVEPPPPVEPQEPQQEDPREYATNNESVTNLREKHGDTRAYPNKLTMDARKLKQKVIDSGLVDKWRDTVTRVNAADPGTLESQMTAEEHSVFEVKLEHLNSLLESTDDEGHRSQLIQDLHDMGRALDKAGTNVSDALRVRQYRQEHDTLGKRLLDGMKRKGEKLSNAEVAKHKKMWEEEMAVLKKQNENLMKEAEWVADLAVKKAEVDNALTMDAMQTKLKELMNAGCHLL